MNQSIEANSKNVRKSRVRPTIQTNLRARGLETNSFYTIREDITSGAAWKLPGFQTPAGAGRHANLAK